MIERMSVGDLPRKHHIQLRSAAGALRYEHCLTRDGFDGPYTIAYHERRPHTAKQGEAKQSYPTPETGDLRALRRRHYDSTKLGGGTTFLASRRPILFNRDVVVSVSRPTTADDVYFSNGDGDDLHFVFQGSGTLRTMLGDVRYQKNDYVFVPRGTIHRFIPDAGAPHWLFSIECLGGMGIPKQWRNPVGQLRMDAPYCHRDFKNPTFEGPRDEGLRHVVVKRQNRFDGFDYDDSPLDVVGWDGSVYPWAFAILDFQPRVGLVHLPPTWHGTFAARGALICSFVPRPVDFHPESVPCPYPHSSVDVDELLFYCDGNFTSRKGVGPGSISHHPAGIAHGPHPGAYEASVGSKQTTELAVMLDCYEPLQPTPHALAIEDAGYHESFR
ncbi:MAG: homogentisate 1,2-dioxygenase [Polyangiaceae bacterium]|nr:homogentisate 1,2-dioxygenase [Polyangiaceae bacterium]